MKLPHRLSQLGTIAAIFLFIGPGNLSRAKDRPAPSRPAGTAVAPNSDSATCSADGKYFAVVAPHGRVHYGRSQDGVILRTFYECQPQALEFSPDGRLLAIAGDFNGRPPRMKIWRVSDGALLCRIETGLRNRLMAFSPDNLLLAVGDDSRLGLWELPKGTPKWMRTPPARISHFSFSSDGKAVDAIGADGSIQIFGDEPGRTPNLKSPSGLAYFGAIWFNKGIRMKGKLWRLCQLKRLDHTTMGGELATF